MKQKVEIKKHFLDPPPCSKLLVLARREKHTKMNTISSNAREGLRVMSIGIGGQRRLTNEGFLVHNDVYLVSNFKN